ncbi:hypothetical protein EB796_003600 [Bugula neritina]|uniref:Guanylate-binding protein N-terminal domain-containing protein n=1 Tax=Bugula neritina TaxID=10212 RepID=A0A7J7KJI9_BUGNE|nr:hypothetical protein EB796_003600 [Bugula neritina]
MAYRRMSSQNREGKPVTIVAFESGYPKIETAALAKVLKDVKQLPLIIVSMIGRARGGKSFFLNLYMNYLNYLEKNGEDGDWESSKTQTSGFPWGMSEEPITKGISVWSKPFIIEPREGEQVRHADTITNNLCGYY